MCVAIISMLVPMHVSVAANDNILFMMEASVVGTTLHTQRREGILPVPEERT